MFRALVTKALGDLLGVLSHPSRLRIVEELGREERDVATLAEELGVRHSAMSQQLSLLRAQGVVLERRDGRHVYYRLRQPEIASWLIEGLKFIEPGSEARELKGAVSQARELWGHEGTTTRDTHRHGTKRRLSPRK